MKKLFLPRSGFSLLELLAVITIIGVLASLIVARVSASNRHAGERACQHNRAQLNAAIERYKLDNGSFPTDVLLLEADYFPSGVPNCPASGVPYQLNAAGNRIDGHVGASHP